MKKRLLNNLAMQALTFAALLTLQRCVFALEPAPSNAVDLLKKAIQAPSAISYRAKETITAKAGNRSAKQEVKVIHKAPGSTSWTYLSGRKVDRVVVDNGKSNWQYIPGSNTIIYSPALETDGELWNSRYLSLMLKNYNVRLAGTATVDGRKATGLDISPKKGHLGPSKKLWLDAQNRLILQSELATSDNKTIIVSRLTDLHPEKSTAAKEFAVPASARNQKVIYEHSASLPVVALAKQWKHPLLVPSSIPDGYILESARLMGREKNQYVSLRYFDGLSVISVFEEPQAVQSKISLKKKTPVHGSTVEWQYHAPFRSVSWRERGVKVTLVGDFSKTKLLEIAKSCKLYSR